MSGTEIRTINEAVVAAMEEWHAGEAPGDDAEGMVTDYAMAAFDEWKSAFTKDGTVTSPVFPDDGTIGNAVIAAMNDWHSSDHDIEEMEALVDEFAMGGIQEYRDRFSSNEISP